MLHFECSSTLVLEKTNLHLKRFITECKISAINCAKEATMLYFGVKETLF